MPDELIAYYGTQQGRISPTRFPPTDGAYAYTLGSDHEALPINAEPGDYIQIEQSIDLTGINVLRFNSRLAQAFNAPTGASFPSCTIQRTEVTEIYDWRTQAYGTAVHPAVQTTVGEPYDVIDNSVLRVSVDGTPQDIILSAVTDLLTAAQVVSRINAAITGAVAQIGPNADDPTVILSANSTGRSATIEVLSHALPAGDANDRLFFYQKATAPTAVYGGDDLSAIISPTDAFTSSLIGQQLSISGAAPANNGSHHVIGVPTPRIAIVGSALTTEGAGFTCTSPTLRWQASVAIDGTPQLTITPEPATPLRSNDFAVNVSKLSGSHTVRFRWELASV